MFQQRARPPSPTFPPDQHAPGRVRQLARTGAGLSSDPHDVSPRAGDHGNPVRHHQRAAVVSRSRGIALLVAWSLEHRKPLALRARRDVAGRRLPHSNRAGPAELRSLAQCLHFPAPPRGTHQPRRCLPGLCLENSTASGHARYLERVKGPAARLPGRAVRLPARRQTACPRTARDCPLFWCLGRKKGTVPLSAGGSRIGCEPRAQFGMVPATA